MRKENFSKDTFKFPTLPVVGTFLVLLLGLLVGFRYMGNDLEVIVKWWLAIALIGVGFYPLSYVLMHKFKDGGYVASKALGIAILSWFIWTLSTFKIMKFTQNNIILLLIICAGLNYGGFFLWSFIKRKKADEDPLKGDTRLFFADFNTDKLIYILFYECLFFTIFMLACYMRSFRVTITNDTEKYMDFGFLASLYNAEYMPAGDMWFSGEPINYYYFGIYVGAFLTKISGTHPGYGYNLDLMTIAALGFVEVYSLVLELVHRAADEYRARNPRKKGNVRSVDRQNDLFSPDAKKNIAGHFAGLIGGLAVFEAGNMQYVLYRIVYPGLQKLLNFLLGLFGSESSVEVYSYWFPESTRFITDGKNRNEGTLIHEFPSYSFVLGDLHAHVTDIIFVILIVTILFAFLTSREERVEKVREAGFEEISLKYIIREAFAPHVIIASFLIGVMKVTNFWDFPIYFVVSGGVLLFSNAILTGFNLKTLILTGVHAVECLVISTLTALPFTLYFDNMAGGIGICAYHSNPYELAVLWALPIAVCVGLYVIAINAYKQRIAGTGKVKKGSVIKVREGRKDLLYNSKGTVNHIYSFIYDLQLSDLFVLTIAACAAGLVLVPELIYVKDIYGGIYERSNTMFKLAYQAFILFGMVMAYGIVRLAGYHETAKQRKLALVAAFFLFLTFGYELNGLKNFTPIKKGPDAVERTLDSRSIIANSESHKYEDEPTVTSQTTADVIDFVLNNIESDKVILQNYATSYRPFATISAFTGNPTVIGWAYHEWLWRTSGENIFEIPQKVIERYEDVATIYTSDNIDEVRSLLAKYDVDYIYVGYSETMDGMTGDTGYAEDKRFYKNNWYTKRELNHDLLRSLGEVVYDKGTVVYEEQCYDYTLQEWRNVHEEFQCYIVKVK